MSLARFDTWARSPIGPAAAGTQVYICTQPATTNTVPPTPLVQLYADPAGISAISQPLVADGFGHAFAYCTAGSYTVVLVLAGRVQQVYPDQLIGSTGSGSSITLQTNGVLNTLQSILNIKGTGTVTATADGVGGVTINGTTVAPTFDNIESGTNTTAVMQVGNGSSLKPSTTNPGSIVGNALIYNFVIDTNSSAITVGQALGFGPNIGGVSNLADANSHACLVALDAGNPGDTIRCQAQGV